jgi:hypothetical protein
MGTGSLPGRSIDHPLLSSAEVKERVELYLHYPSGPSWQVIRFTFIIIIIIIIIIGKDTLSFMQGIYTCIPETNHVPKEYSVAAILLLLFMVPISLVPVLVPMYFYISTFRSMCSAQYGRFL